MLRLSSPFSLSLSRIGDHWGGDSPDQHCTLSPHLGATACQILLLSLYFQGILPASDRVPLRPCISGLLRYNPHQHLSVWRRKRRPMVNGGGWHSILAGCWPRCNILGWDLSHYVRRQPTLSGVLNANPSQLVDPDIHHCPDDSDLDLPGLSYAHHWTSRWYSEC